MLPGIFSDVFTNNAHIRMRADFGDVRAAFGNTLRGTRTMIIIILIWLRSANVCRSAYPHVRTMAQRVAGYSASAPGARYLPAL